MTHEHDVILAWEGAYILANKKQPPKIRKWANGWFQIGNMSKKYRLSDIEKMTQRLLNRMQNVSD